MSPANHMENEQEQAKQSSRSRVIAPPAPKNNRYAEKHGFNTLKKVSLRYSVNAPSTRSAVAKALKRWKLELVADLGGRDNVLHSGPPSST